MATMNVSLPDSLKAFVDDQVTNAGYGTSSEYIRELLRREQDRLRLREILLEGAQARLSGSADEAYFASLRRRTAKRGTRRG
jgi:antitoxin ParD1/3/4